MTDEPKRRSYAVDDVETISRRMKEIAAEREASRDDLPSDTEPSAFKRTHPAQEPWSCEQTVNRRATLVKQDDGSWRWVGEELGRETPDVYVDPASIYSDAYWQPLIDAGILSMVEPGDA